MKHTRNPQRLPFRQRFYRFMYGRNGTDTLGSAALFAALLLMILEAVTHWWWLSILSLALLIYSNFRVFSKNLVKRRTENAAFCALWKKVKNFFSLQKSKWRDRKTHVYRKCPHCKNVLRLPRRAGKHTVNCPCCHKRFDVKV